MSGILARTESIGIIAAVRYIETATRRVQKMRPGLVGENEGPIKERKYQRSRLESYL